MPLEGESPPGSIAPSGGPSALLLPSPVEESKEALPRRRGRGLASGAAAAAARFRTLTTTASESLSALPRRRRSTSAAGPGCSSGDALSRGRTEERSTRRRRSGAGCLRRSRPATAVAATGRRRQFRRSPLPLPLTPLSSSPPPPREEGRRGSPCHRQLSLLSSATGPRPLGASWARRAEEWEAASALAAAAARLLPPRRRRPLRAGHLRQRRRLCTGSRSRAGSRRRRPLPREGSRARSRSSRALPPPTESREEEVTKTEKRKLSKKRNEKPRALPEKELDCKNTNGFRTVYSSIFCYKARHAPSQGVAVEEEGGMGREGGGEGVSFCFSFPFPSFFSPPLRVRALLLTSTALSPSASPPSPSRVLLLPLG